MMKKFLRWSALLLALCCCLTAFAAAEDEPVVITTSVDTLTVAVGRIADYELSISPRSAKKGYTFTISDESIAEVLRDGRVKGLKPGNCTLTIGSKANPTATKVLDVIVVKPARSVKAQLDQETISVGGTAQITAAVTPDDATLQGVTYESRKPEVATVDENGVVTGVSRGSAAIRVKSEDGYAQTSVTVQVRQPAEEIQLELSKSTLPENKTASVKATVLPKNTNNKKLTWTSSDESIATVNQDGRVKGLRPGTVTITAASAEVPEVTGSIEVQVVRLAKSVAFAQKEYGVILGQTAQLSVTVSPEDTTDKSVTYQSNNPKKVSVDENGVVTALAAGKATITATTADGSRRQATTAVKVIVPVTGVHFDTPDARVGVDYYRTLNAVLEPKEATNHNMTWTSSDESIATVTGTTNKPRVVGKRWGRCVVTGVTEDGGYTCTVNINVGSLRHAAKLVKLELRNHQPYLRLKNVSNLNLTGITFAMKGTDEHDQPITMSFRTGDTLYAEYPSDLGPDETTYSGGFMLYQPADFSHLENLSVAITGWTTDTGYYGSDGQLYYTYNVPQDQWDWISVQTDLYRTTPRTPTPTQAPTQTVQNQ